MQQNKIKVIVILLVVFVILIAGGLLILKVMNGNKNDNGNVGIEERP